MYGHEGAVWEANDSKDVWYAKADRFFAALPTAPTQSAGGTEHQHEFVRDGGPESGAPDYCRTCGEVRPNPPPKGPEHEA